MFVTIPLSCLRRRRKGFCTFLSQHLICPPKSTICNSWIPIKWSIRANLFFRIRLGLDFEKSIFLNRDHLKLLPSVFIWTQAFKRFYLTSSTFFTLSVCGVVHFLKESKSLFQNKTYTKPTCQAVRDTNQDSHFSNLVSQEVSREVKKIKIFQSVQLLWIRIPKSDPGIREWERGRWPVHGVTGCPASCFLPDCR